ncbi:hypothetical protein SAMN04490198_5437 [Pseudomonas palleroniana]|uniref:Uncharacterized protein n=1 Tax=Pseudomonas palleroniana TaxID=191390 RepID=A0A1H5P7S7_9PSED|nr:hypothetical protein SAMN04490198_5437 [Pseudomonas palleroniana]
MSRSARMIHAKQQILVLTTFAGKLPSKDMHNEAIA